MRDSPLHLVGVPDQFLHGSSLVRQRYQELSSLASVALQAFTLAVSERDSSTSSVTFASEFDLSAGTGDLCNAMPAPIHQKNAKAGPGPSTQKKKQAAAASGNGMKKKKPVNAKRIRKHEEDNKLKALANSVENFVSANYGAACCATLGFLTSSHSLFRPCP